MIISDEAEASGEATQDVLMCSSGEPVSTGASARPEPIASGFPFFGAGEDPAPTGMEVDTFGEAAAPLPQSQQFSHGGYASECETSLRDGL